MMRNFSGRPDGSWDKIAEQMMLNFSASGHPISRASSDFERGELKAKEVERNLFTSTVAKKTLK